MKVHPHQTTLKTELSEYQTIASMMEDDGDDKDNTKRQTRNLSEKKRRDQFNSLVTELCTLISNNTRKMDKSTVLRSTISFLKNHNEVTVRSRAHDVQEDWKPGFLSNEEFTYFFMEAFEGFIMVFSTSGQIQYASESITSLLGHNPAEIVNKNIFDMMHKDDQQNIFNLLQRNAAMNHIENQPKENEMIRFLCHVRRGCLDFREEDSYDVVHFYGHFRKNQEHNNERDVMDFQDVESRLLFVCIGGLYTPKFIRDVSLFVSSRSEFTSRHSLEWKFLFLDHRAPPIIGYLPFEVLGTSGYDYYHFDDLEKVITCHEALMQKGELTSCFYRFLTKGQQWIWLQSRFYITYHQWNSKPEFIVCTHRVVSYADAIKTKEELDEQDTELSESDNIASMREIEVKDSTLALPYDICEMNDDAYADAYPSTPQDIFEYGFRKYEKRTTQSTSESLIFRVPRPKAPKPLDPQILASEAPPFHVPAFQVPVSEVSVFQASSFQVPVSQDQPFQVPAFQVPVSQVPVFQGSAFQVPASQVPASQVSACQVPESQFPAFQVPASQFPDPVPKPSTPERTMSSLSALLESYPGPFDPPLQPASLKSSSASSKGGTITQAAVSTADTWNCAQAQYTGGSNTSVSGESRISLRNSDREPASVKSSSASSKGGTITQAAVSTADTWNCAQAQYTGGSNISVSGESRICQRNSDREPLIQPPSQPLPLQPLQPTKQDCLLAPQHIMGAQYLETMPSIAGAVQPGLLSLTATPPLQDQTQIQEQLHRKHDELQQMIARQQEELRQVKEQLVLARLGILHPLINVPGSSYSATEEVMQNQEPDYSAQGPLPQLALPSIPTQPPQQPHPDHQHMPQ